MTVLYDGEIHVHYGFLHVHADGELPPADFGLGGQINGLCGAANPGVLSMLTGLHTGEIPIVVEVLDAEPALTAAWEDVVEASFTAPQTRLALSAFQDFRPLTLPAPGSYRARYHATGMDAAREADTRMDDAPALDRYLLQLWPAPPGPDAILRQTSSVAAMWHAQARRTPPPPSAEERAAAERAAEEERARQEEATLQRRHERHVWEGSPPSEKLAQVGSRAHDLVHLDWELADAIVAVDSRRQRALGAWAARMASRYAGVDQLDWIAEALMALDEGQPLPASFSGPSNPFARLFSGRAVATGVRRAAPRPGSRVVLAPEAAALDSILNAADPNPTAAAINALMGAVAGREDPSELLADTRRFLAE